MAKKEDPFMLENYRFLPCRKKCYVDAFIDMLDETCREFAVKRYVEGKTISQVAEEMGYTDRAIYLYREKIIELWNLYSQDDYFAYHRQRIIAMIRKHGVIEHSKLTMNMNLKRSGLKYSDFIEMIKALIASGDVKCTVISKFKPKRIYSLGSNFVITLSDYDKVTIVR